MSSLRILFVSHEASLTGAPLILLHIIRHLRDEHGVEPYVVIRASTGDIRLEPFLELAPVWCAWEKQPADWPTSFDLIYSNTVTNGIFIERLRSRGTPVLTHVHELSDSILAYGRNNLTCVLRQTSRFIACSPSVQFHLLHNFAIAESDLSMVPEFINARRIDRMINSEDTDPGSLITAMGSDFVIGAAGWASYRKGTDLFVNLLQSLPESIHGRRISLAWVGGNFDSFRSALSPELQARVFAVGPQPNPFPFFQRFDVFAMTSREDPFPLVMLENAYLSRPIVGFIGSGGFDDLVAADAAYGVQMLNVGRLAHTITMLASNTALAARLGAKARHVVEAFLDEKALPQIWSAVQATLSAPVQVERKFPDSIFSTVLDARLNPTTLGSACLYFGPGEAYTLRAAYDRTASAAFEFVIPPKESDVHVRFDPDFVPGIFDFIHLSVTDSEGTLLFRQGDSDGWDKIQVGGTSRVLSSGKSLKIASHGVDPQIILPAIHANGRALIFRCEMNSSCCGTELGLAVQSLLTHPSP